MKLKLSNAVPASNDADESTATHTDTTGGALWRAGPNGNAEMFRGVWIPTGWRNSQLNAANGPFVLKRD